MILDKADTTVEEFTAELTTALVYMQQEGTETVNQRLGKQYNLTRHAKEVLDDMNEQVVWTSSVLKQWIAKRNL